MGFFGGGIKIILSAFHEESRRGKLVLGIYADWQGV